MKKTLSLAALPLCVAPVFGQGADECVAAVFLGTGPTIAAFDTNACSDTGAAATTSLEQQCSTLSADVWLRYVAQSTGTASFDTCNNATFDTEIGFWEGSDCSTFVGLGCNDDAFALGCSGTTSFLADVPVTAGRTYYVQLGYYSVSGGTWGAGTLTITESGGGTGSDSIGTNYCVAPPNGTGVPGAMSAVGSTIVAMNDVTLTASSLPSNQFGIFVVGPVPAFVPGAGGSSNGNICIGGIVRRYNQGGQILSTGATGSFSLQINLQTVHQGNDIVMTMPGDSWFFQAWYRSGLGLGSNFTDGLEIAFN